MKRIFIVACLALVKSCVAANPYWYWYLSSEEIDAYENGDVPTLSCPLGSYRNIKGGFRQDGCTPCPPGRYGSSTSLASSQCTGACPLGTYLDAAGGQSVRDCRPCPKGTYGDTQGLTTRECSGRCSDLNTVKTKFYGISEGLTSKSGCIVCREGYLDAHGQCDNKKAFMERYTKE
mmetsp:Transcript_24272/g.50858  ORF Transcript_24272/g.50858 Transcript_24272/m.50858 type:complete len:176 (-) Transcript_24272:77-604(-)